MAVTSDIANDGSSRQTGREKLAGTMNEWEVSNLFELSGTNYVKLSAERERERE